LLSLLFAFMCIRLKANQVVTALIMNIFALGVAALIHRSIFGAAYEVPPYIRPLAPLPVPLVDQIPLLGPAFFRQPGLYYLVWILVPLTNFILYRTYLGLSIRAAGEQPYAAASLGINVNAIRYLCVLFGGLTAGLGGWLVVTTTGFYQSNIIAGRGFMALSVVIFGQWSPYGAMGGALLFGLANAIQFYLQAIGLQVPSQFILMLPYLLTVAVLWLAVRWKGRVGTPGGPAYLGIPYYPEGE